MRVPPRPYIFGRAALPIPLTGAVRRVNLTAPTFAGLIINHVVFSVQCPAGLGIASTEANIKYRFVFVDGASSEDLVLARLFTSPIPQGESTVSTPRPRHTSLRRALPLNLSVAAGESFYLEYALDPSSFTNSIDVYGRVAVECMTKWGKV